MSVAKLKSKVEKMIDENIKHEKESSEKEKKIRELTKTITNLKNQVSFNEEISEKRESQINSLLLKIKSQEQEIQSFKSEIFKKSNYLQHLHGELVELRPSKDASILVEKQSKQIEDLKKTIFSKNNEISMMKSLISSWKTHYVNRQENSKSPKLCSLRPGQFPKVSNSKSGLFSKKTGSVNSSVWKSVRNDDNKADKDYEFNDSFLKNISENSDDLKKGFDEFMINEDYRINEENTLSDEAEKEKIVKEINYQENNKIEEILNIENLLINKDEQILRAKIIDNIKKEKQGNKPKANTIIRKK